MNVLISEYVFRIKSSGLKAHLVAPGLLQVHGVSYVEKYASVVSTITVRMLFALVPVRNLELDQRDVETEFLYGDLDKYIYMEVYEGLRDHKHPNLVCKLLKSLNGRKRAPRQWYAKIHSFLVELGIKSSQKNPCLYTLHTQSEFILTVLYVDDLEITGNKRASIFRISRELKKRFEIKNLKEAIEIPGEEFQSKSLKLLLISQPSEILCRNIGTIRYGKLMSDLHTFRSLIQTRT